MNSIFNKEGEPVPRVLRVAILEDDEDYYQPRIIETVESSGHEVVAVASSRPEADQIIQQLESLQVEVIIVDGNLSHYSKGGVDGKEIIKSVHDTGFPITVIGFSTDELPEANIDLRKDLQQLPSTLNSLSLQKWLDAWQTRAGSQVEFLN